MKLYFQRPDGTYESSFAEDYSINAQRQVWSKKRHRFLKPDAKHRVWLSVAGQKVCVNMNKAYEVSASVARGEPLVIKFTNKGTKEIALPTINKTYHWRIPAQLEFAFDTERQYEPKMPEQEINYTQQKKFMRYITKEDLRNLPAFRPTFKQLSSWLFKYLDATMTLHDYYDLYRDVRVLNHSSVHWSTIILRNEPEHSWLSLDTEGAITTSTTRQIKSYCAQTGTAPLPSTSRMLTANRLIFAETANLITGPFLPLLTWVFRGKPQPEYQLFCVTGNVSDKSASNWVWIPAQRRHSYMLMCRWLTRRWYYENR